MPPAQVSDFPEMEEQAAPEGRRDHGLLANWRVLAITFYLGISLFQYGFDKGALAGFQAMPGFLMVFGYETPKHTWAIAVSFHVSPPQIAFCAATHDYPSL